MTDRRSPGKIAAERAWDRFVSANDATIAASGLPPSYLQSVARFDDFLMHGRLEHHPDDVSFQVESLDAGQYARLVRLVESYFAAGYEWFTPLALRVPDRQRLGARFAGPQAP